MGADFNHPPSYKSGASVHAENRLHKIRVWDLPTRVFHWSLLIGVSGLVVSGLVGGGALAWHFRFGYCVMALLAFRIIWGLVGGRWSRFGAFIYAPQSVINYLKGRGKPEHSVGHSPLGAASVFALLIVLLAQVGTGLMSDDEISFQGPLAHLVSNATVQLATFYHAAVGKWVLLGLVVLHIGAIIFYQRRQHHLIGAMVHGDKTLALEAPSARDDAVSRAAALVILAMCGAGAFWVSTLAAPVF
jgi:cytochrome b